MTGLIDILLKRDAKNYYGKGYMLFTSMFVF